MMLISTIFPNMVHKLIYELFNALTFKTCFNSCSTPICMCVQILFKKLCYNSKQFILHIKPLYTLNVKQHLLLFWYNFECSSPLNYYNINKFKKFYRKLIAIDYIMFVFAMFTTLEYLNIIAIDLCNI